MTPTLLAAMMEASVALRAMETEQTTHRSCERVLSLGSTLLWQDTQESIIKTPATSAHEQLALATIHRRLLEAWQVWQDALRVQVPVLDPTFSEPEATFYVSFEHDTLEHGPQAQDITLTFCNLAFPWRRLGNHAFPNFFLNSRLAVAGTLIDESLAILQALPAATARWGFDVNGKNYRQNGTITRSYIDGTGATAQDASLVCAWLQNPRRTLQGYDEDTAALRRHAVVSYHPCG